VKRGSEPTLLSIRLVPKFVDASTRGQEGVKGMSQDLSTSKVFFLVMPGKRNVLFPKGAGP